MIDLGKLRARVSGLPDSDGAIGPTWCTPVETLELLDYVAQLEEEVKNKEAAQAQRTPLSATEVSGLLESAGYWPGDSSRADFINGIRYAEMEHGITQEKQG